MGEHRGDPRRGRDGVTDIVSITTYVVAGQELGPVMAARDAAFGGHLAASTLVTVPALARPEWLVEVAVVAAATSPVEYRAAFEYVVPASPHHVLGVAEYSTVRGARNGGDGRVHTDTR